MVAWKSFYQRLLLKRLWIASSRNQMIYSSSTYNNIKARFLSNFLEKLCLIQKCQSTNLNVHCVVAAAIPKCLTKSTLEHSRCI